MRLETKYYLNINKFQLIKNYLITNKYNLDENCKNFNSYEVTSIYFDNHKLDSYYEKVNGVRGRYKLRLRYYNLSNDYMCLEIKHKKNYFIWKDKFYFEKVDVINYLGGKRSKLKNFINLNFPNYKPICIVSYDRLAFLRNLNKNQERYSFDKNLKFSYGHLNIKNLISKGKLSRWKKINSNNIIFEIKTNNEQNCDSNKIVKKFNLNWEEISKYILGMSRFKLDREFY